MTETLTEPAKMLLLKHLLIVPKEAERRTEVDSWENGCDPDSCKSEELSLPAPSSDLVAVMADMVGRKLTREDVYTMEPNIFRDTPGKEPGYRVVDDRTARGLYRAEYDCNEPGAVVTGTLACAKRGRPSPKRRANDESQRRQQASYNRHWQSC